MLLGCSMWTRDRMVVFLTLTATSIGLIPFGFAESPKNAAAAKETARPRSLNEEKVKSQLASFRSNRTPNPRRVAIVKELSAFGPEASESDESDEQAAATRPNRKRTTSRRFDTEILPRVGNRMGKM